MLVSLALIFLCGLFLGKLFSLCKLPSLLGMLATGILLGPYVFNLIDVSILQISAPLRQIALIIILARAGLSLNISELKQAGRGGALLCFVPACFEIVGMLILAPMLLGITPLEALVMGTVIAAVSPAVIVPQMLAIKEAGYGTNKSIPQMVLAGASVDDVFVIVLFTVFSGLLQSGTLQAGKLLAIPTSIILGLCAGLLVGVLLALIFSKFHMRDSIKILIILSFAFLLVSAESLFTGNIGFSGLLAVMALGFALRSKKKTVANRLSIKFSKLWVGAQIMLFVLVGASVNIGYAVKVGGVAILLIAGVLGFRIVGVFISLLKTNLLLKERLFVAIAYLPKATVQAAIGALPLAMGLACGQQVLTMAVISILITAPLGSFLIDTLYKKLLQKNTAEN